MKLLIPWMEINNVDVWIGNKKIFSNLELNLHINQNTVVIGPNAAGKSCLVKLIDRSIYPMVKNKSSIKFFGEENINLWNLRSKVGFLSTDLETRISSRTSVYEVVTSGYSGSFNPNGEELLNNGKRNKNRTQLEK